MSYFTYNRHNTFTVHVPKLITVFFFLSSRNSQQLFKMSSTSTNARIDTSDYGLSHPFQGAWAVANGLSGTQMCW